MRKTQSRLLWNLGNGKQLLHVHSSWPGSVQNLSRTLWFSGMRVQESKIAPKSPLSMKRFNPSPNVSDIKLCYMSVLYWTYNTKQFVSFNWLNFCNSRKTVNIGQLWLVLREFLCGWLIFILECCASGYYTQDPLFPRRISTTPL